MKNKTWLVRPMAVAVGSCFSVAPAFANPTNPQFSPGTVQIQGLGTKDLKVTTLIPGAIIRWDSFSIPTGNTTYFQQPSAASAVLNRVVLGADMSRINGMLGSNGRVFLINPAGILIGAGAVIDTAGFVGSTLRMQDADFVAGKLKFEGDASSGSITNQGWIKTGYGGNVVLVAPHIENSGRIHTPGGQLVLAAGQKLTIGSLDLEGVQFQIQAPTDSVLNVGELLADGGAVGVFAGTLRHTGDIRANALVRDEAGRIVLKAHGELTATKDSTIAASGKTGGNVLIQSETGHARVAGYVEAQGRAGKGGDVRLLGERVSLTDQAVIDASGTSGGGQIRVGGDYQGANPDLPNASRAFVGTQARLRANSDASGDGGRIIVWSDKDTQFYGHLSARGGADGGAGGFAEVSGKDSLIFAGGADLSAPKGAAGNLLLDPLYLFVDSRGGSITSILDEPTDVPGNAVTVSPTTLSNIAGNVTLFASRYMRINSAITLTGGNSLTATVGTHTPASNPVGTPPNRLDLGADITTGGGAVSLTAPRIQTVATSAIATNGGAIALNATGLVDDPQNSILASNLTLNAGAGAVQLTSGNTLQVGPVTSGPFTATAPSQVSVFGAIAASGAVTLESTENQVRVDGALGAVGAVRVTAQNADLRGNVDTGGGVLIVTAPDSVRIRGNTITGNGAVTLTASDGQVRTVDVAAGSAAVNASGRSIQLGTVDTTGVVNLTGTAGTVSARVDNSIGVTASSTSTSPNQSASVNITSGTALNVDSAIATIDLLPPSCNFFSCPSASVNLNGSGTVRVGTVIASAPTNLSFNSLGESVTITSNTGSILRAASGASQITAADVTLTTGQLTGGGIGTAAAPMNVDVARRFQFSPNGPFAVALNGASGPNQLIVTAGRMPTNMSYGNGIVSGGGIALDVSANDTTVTLNNLTVTEVTGGFKTNVNNQAPRITFNVPNGALVATSVTVPEGGTAATGSAPLPVTLSASGDVTVSSYTRQSTADSLAKSTQISSGGNVTLGTLNASRDDVFVSANGNVSISATSLTTRGNVNISSGGNTTVGFIDTASGTGSVSINAGGNVLALNNGGGLEIQSGGNISITGNVIGTSGFANPFDLASGAGSLVTLNTPSATGQIGFSAQPIIANTARLSINATTAMAGATPSFEVSTGSVPLQDLSVRMPHTGAGLVTSDGKTYTYTPAGGSITVTPDANANAQFANGLFSFTATTGNVNLANTNLGATGTLRVFATGSARSEGSIATGTLDAQHITLTAGTAGSTAGSGSSRITTGVIGGTVRPDSVNISAGFFGGDCFFCVSRSGSFESGGAVFGNTINITTINGELKFGPNGDDNIGSLANPAGTVTLNANREGNTSSTGSILVGSIFANDARLRSRASVTTGALEATTINIGRPDGNAGPVVVTQGIGAQRPLSSLTIDSTSTNIQGAITGDGNPGNFISIGTSGAAGDLTVAGTITNLGDRSTVTLDAARTLSIGPSPNGVITAGDGSAITLTHRLTSAPLRFATIGAGPGGSVTIGSASGIEQNGAGSGITAGTIGLSATAGSILRNGGDGLLDLNSVGSLTLNSNSAMALDANASKLANLTITKSTTNTPFTLANLTGQTVNIGAGASAMTLEVNSPGGTAADRLNFTLTGPGGGVATSGAGIITSGGRVNITAGGPLDASVGGITTSASDQGGAVTLTTSGTSGTVSTGAINTAPTDLTIGGAPITVTTNCATCDITVSGTLRTSAAGGAAGSTISLQANTGGSITRSGAFDIISQSGVTISTGGGNIGASGTPLLITTPVAVLNAAGPAGGSAAAGNVFATLEDTSNLNLTAHTGFNVTSDTAFDALAVATRGTSTSGTTTLTGPQTYSFARPVTDLFGNTITNTFEIVTAAGAVPATSATFTAVDGDLLVRGGANLAPTNLTLQTLSSTGDLKLQGNAATPLILTNNGAQTFASGRHLEITNKATITGGVQTLSSSTGNISLLGGGVAGEAVVVTANTQQVVSTDAFSGGNLILSGGVGNAASARLVAAGASDQRIDARGNITLTGGGAGGSASLAEITTNAGSQLVRAGGNILLSGGDGIDAIARIANTGAGTQQVGQSNFSSVFQTDNITLQGGTGTGSGAEITAGGQQQLFTRFGTIGVLGGSGTNAYARVDSSGTGEQRLGNDSCCSGSETTTINVQGGTGTGAYARVTAPNVSSFNRQRIRASTSILVTGGGTDAPAMITASTQDISRGSITLTAGIANNANALIQSTGSQSIDPANLTLRHAAGGGAGALATAQILSGADQNIFASAVSMTAGAAPNAISRIGSVGAQRFDFNSLSMTGGSGANAFVRVDSAASQQSFGNGSVTMLGGGGADAFARIDGPTQSFNFGAITMDGGSGTNAFARIDAAGTQNLNSFGSSFLRGGTAAGTFAKIDAGGTQSLRFGNLTLTARGTAAAPLTNAGALIEGHAQNISAGTLTLNGGAGTPGSGNTSDAILRNLSGDHVVSTSRIVMNGGARDSTTGILNSGTGTQDVSGTNGIALAGNAVGADAHADVLIQSPAATAQTLTASSGGITLDNTGTGLASISSGGPQTLTSRFVDIVTSAGSTGNSTISSAANQWLHTTNGTTAPEASLRVAARGTGLASLDSAAVQLLEIDFPEVMQGAPTAPGSILVGRTDAVGTSVIQAVDQHVFARAITVQAGSGAGSSASITGTGTQVISTLDGGVSVLGGGGAGSVAKIDLGPQSIVSNGPVAVTGGGVSGAAASIMSNGTQTVIATKGDVTVQGGSAANTTASIDASGAQVVTAAGEVKLLGGTGGALLRTIANQIVSSTNAIRLSAESASALVQAAGDQQLSGSTIVLDGGTGANTTARITTNGAQTLSFNALNLTAGGANGSFVLIDSGGAQTLNGGAGDIILTAMGTEGAPLSNASATIQGHAQTLSCGIACNLLLIGGSGTAAPDGNRSDAVLRNLSGAQAITAGTITLEGGQVFSSTGIINAGSGSQAVTATNGPLAIALFSHLDARSSASVLIENQLPTAQTVTALGGETRLDSRGAGSVAISSAGTQVIDTNALDVATLGSGTSTSSVVSIGDQTIRTRGVLPATTISARVGSGSLGTAKIESGAAQTLNIGHASDTVPDTLMDRDFVIGRTDAGNAAGDSLVFAAGNQIVRAGSVLVQGPSGDDRISKLSANATQIVTTLTGGVSIIGGSGADSLATIDPTNQIIDSAGPILLRGGSGPNADALINATGPQSVIARSGAVSLVGGTGQGADALIVTTSPFQTVQAPLGVIIQQGPPGGGAAGLQQGQQTTDVGSTVVAAGILRERDQLDEIENILKETVTDQNEGARARGRAQTCS